MCCLRDASLYSIQIKCSFEIFRLLFEVLGSLDEGLMNSFFVKTSNSRCMCSTYVYYLLTSYLYLKTLIKKICYLLQCKYLRIFCSSINLSYSSIPSFHILLPSLSHCILKRPHLRINYPSTASHADSISTCPTRSSPCSPCSPCPILLTVQHFTLLAQFLIHSIFRCPYERFKHFCKH